MNQAATDASGGPVAIFDSGLGGLSVVRAIRRVLPDLPLIYVADDAGFPYGGMAAGRLATHVIAALDRVIADHDPSAIVVACNTASTLVLEPLRSRHTLPIVGTVPAIKPAAEQSRSGIVSVLATPGTIERDYTRDLVARFAGGCHVRLVGAPLLAEMAENHLRNASVDPDLVWEQIRPCFQEIDGRRTDMVVLACTHFPFLTDIFSDITPWPVTWLDPAPAIARRLADVIAGKLVDNHAPDMAEFTSGRSVGGPIGKLFAQFGFAAPAN